MYASDYFKTAPNTSLFGNTNSVWKQVCFWPIPAEKRVIRILDSCMCSLRNSIQAYQTQACSPGRGRACTKTRIMDSCW